MRNLIKQDCPEVLRTNAAAWLREYLADPDNSTKRYRYRDKAIKAALRGETGEKCIYCESKIGHNTPGDIEHKIPSSKNPNRHFEWENLSIACTECNRRKNDYYENPQESFLDPYSENVEAQLQHLGPIVLWRPGHARAEITVRILEIHNGVRTQLLGRKIEKLEEVSNLLDRVETTTGSLREILILRLREMASALSEYSAMVLAQLSNAMPDQQWE